MTLLSHLGWPSPDTSLLIFERLQSWECLHHLNTQASTFSAALDGDLDVGETD